MLSESIHEQLIEMSRLSNHEGLANPSAFIGGSIFLDGPGGKRKISTADERR
jgi:hypothetical protein